MHAVIRLVLALFLLSEYATATFGAGIDELITNRNPSPDWNRASGSLFQTAKSYAVVVGISEYMGAGKGGYPRIDTVSQDPIKMKDFLLNSAGFDYVYLLTEERATKARIDELTN
ncbi:hypothetical protein CO670_04475 [Rhizobium sp. J15]|uniref:hypothetical protein n=1 Tax=Rhizobium sp. J15 TaxID=2035450 RepID=UPI000BEA4D9F|nr:hypothetical protein [Rhizobium sp. J15]PDT18056.1 hypothetical protein CO670_04475 [Rhizobium sp. J15]